MARATCGGGLHPPYKGLLTGLRLLGARVLSRAGWDQRDWNDTGLSEEPMPAAGHLLQLAPRWRLTS